MNERHEDQKNTVAHLVLPLLFIALLGVRSISTGSFWMHLASGHYIAENGLAQADPFSFATSPERPWLNDTWLYDWLLFKLWQFGQAPLVILAHVASVVAAFSLLAAVSRPKAGVASVGLALLICGWLFASQFIISPFVLAAVFPALFMAALETNAGRRFSIPLLVCAQILWTNLHVSFLLGPFMALLAIWQSRSAGAEAAASDLVTRRIALAALLMGATLVNPYGIRLPATALHRLADPSANIVLEWISPFASMFNFPWAKYLTTAVLALTAAGFIFIRQRLPILITTSAVLGVFLLVRSIGFSSAAAVLALPFLCLSLQAMGEFVGERFRRGASTARLATTALALCSIAAIVTNTYYRSSGSASVFGLRVQDDVFPRRFLDETRMLAQATNRTINLPVDGGYLLWARPQEKIFCDTRQAVYGARFYQNVRDALRGDVDSWSLITKTWQPRRVLLNCCWPGAAEAMRGLLASGAWTLAYCDGTSALLVMDVDSRMPAMRKAGLDILDTTRREYESRLGEFPPPGNPSRLIGAAMVFQALGRYEEAESLFSLLTRGSPAMSSAWLGLCNSQIEQGKIEPALETMAEAEKRISLQARVWLRVSLHRAYQRAGMKLQAEGALAEARALNVDFANYFTGTNAPRAASAPLPPDERF